MTTHDGFHCACTQGAQPGSGGRCTRCGRPVLGTPEAARAWLLARRVLRARTPGFGSPRVEVELHERGPDSPTSLLRVSARGWGVLFTREYVAPREVQPAGIIGWWARGVDAVRSRRVVFVLGATSAWVRMAASAGAATILSIGLTRAARYEVGFADGVEGWLAGATLVRTPEFAPRRIPLSVRPVGFVARAPALVAPHIRLPGAPTLHASTPRLAVADLLPRALVVSRPSFGPVVVPSTVRGPLLRRADPQEPA